MAREFGCNLEAVDRTSSQLKTVADELKGFHGRSDEFHWALVSGKIEDAIREFSKDSSDFRDKVSGTITALHEMLQGVVDGVRSIDRGLTESLPDAEELKLPAQGKQP